MNRQEIVDSILMERIDEENAVSFRASCFCSKCEHTDESFVHNANELEARTATIAKMMAHLARAHDLIPDDQRPPTLLQTADSLMLRGAPAIIVLRSGARIVCEKITKTSVTISGLSIGAIEFVRDGMADRVLIDDIAEMLEDPSQ